MFHQKTFNMKQFQNDQKNSLLDQVYRNLKPNTQYRLPPRTRANFPFKNSLLFFSIYSPVVISWLSWHFINGMYGYAGFNCLNRADVCVLTFARLFFGGFAAAVAEARHRLDVTLAHRWGMKHQFGWTGQADRKSCSTHQDTGYA